MNPNTVAKAYRELEHEGVIELRHGSGAFVSEAWLNNHKPAKNERALPVVREVLRKLRQFGLGEDEIRRLFEAELSHFREDR